MVDDYLTLILTLIFPLIIPALIGAFAAIIVNNINYRNTTHKENKTKFLKEQITELLLPLFIYFKNMERIYTYTFTDQNFPDNLRGDPEGFMNAFGINFF